MREHPPCRQRHSDQAPCDSCEHADQCRLDGHGCHAFESWVNSGRWKPEQRSRPRTLPNGREQPSSRIGVTNSVRRVTATKSAQTAAAVPESVIAAKHRDETAPNPAPRCAVATIDAQQEGTSGAKPIASQSAPEVRSKCLSLSTDEHAANVRREAKATGRNEVLPTFEESRRARAIEYLTHVLTATGGERAAAARLAGVGRTTMQALIKRHGVSIGFDPKSRGRHGRRRAPTGSKPTRAAPALSAPIAERETTRPVTLKPIDIDALVAVILKERNSRIAAIVRDVRRRARERAET